jgi:hypothetical protein
VKVTNPLYNERRRGSYGIISKYSILVFYYIAYRSFYRGYCQNIMGFNARELVPNIAVSLVCRMDYGTVWSSIRCNRDSCRYRCVALDEKAADGF